MQRGHSPAGTVTFSYVITHVRLHKCQQCVAKPMHLHNEKISCSFNCFLFCFVLFCIVLLLFVSFRLTRVDVNPLKIEWVGFLLGVFNEE